MFIYNPSKNRRSGTGMQKMPRRGSLRRANEVRNCFPGYPWNGSFQKREDALEYLSGDTLTCLLCGNVFKSIGYLHLRIHGLDASSYKERFGIPQSWGLLGSSTLLKAKERAEITGFSAYGTETRGKKARSKRLKTQVSHVKFVKDENAQRFRNIPVKIKHIDFDWHIEMIEKRYDFRTHTPPLGIASWSCFKKRLRGDVALQQRKIAAIAKRKATG